MKRIVLCCTVAAALSILTGCLTFPRSPEGTSMPSYVGDRNTVAIGTVVAAVSVDRGSTPYQNLNAALAVLIDTRKTAILSDTRDVRQIVWRNQPRIFARVVEAVSGARIAEPEDIANLRAKIAAEAQAEFDALFRQWSDAGKYDVRIVVTGLWLTSPDAGHAPSRPAWMY